MFPQRSACCRPVTTCSYIVLPQFEIIWKHFPCWKNGLSRKGFKDLFGGAGNHRVLFRKGYIQSAGTLINLRTFIQEVLFL
jgi:hypothetical protein